MFRIVAQMGLVGDPEYTNDLERCPRQMSVIVVK